MNRAGISKCRTEGCGPSLVQHFLSGYKCEQRKDCADDHKRYSEQYCEGDHPVDSFFMGSLSDADDDGLNQGKGKSSCELKHAG